MLRNTFLQIHFASLLFITQLYVLFKILTIFCLQYCYFLLNISLCFKILLWFLYLNEQNAFCSDRIFNKFQNMFTFLCYLYCIYTELNTLTRNCSFAYIYAWIINKVFEFYSIELIYAYQEISIIFILFF